MFLFGVSWLAAAIGVAVVAGKDPTPAQIDAIFKNIDRTDSPGCSIAVERDGVILYTKGYGAANLEYGIPNSPSTVFHIASISKEFTAFAIQLLVEDGKLKLGDDIRKYIPEMHEFSHPVTIENLLHHTSGIRDQWELAVMGGWRMDDVITQDDLLGLLFRQQELNFDPGSKYMYSNGGYTLLATIVQRVSGKSLRDFCEARIFKPLGMTHTHFHDDYTEIVPNRAASYYKKNEGGFRLAILSYSNDGATSLFTTVEDFPKWAHNFDDPLVGGSNVIARMLTTKPLTTGGANNYACGLALGNYRGLPIVEHSGADAGYRSDFLRFPDQKFSVCIFANVGNAGPENLARKVADLYLGPDFKPGRRAPRPPAVAVDDGVLKSYSGCFQFSPDAIGRFSTKDGKLTVTYVNGKPILLTAVSKTSFRSPTGTLYTFSKSSQGLGCSRVTGEEEQVGEYVPDADASPSYLNSFVGEYYSEELRQVYRVEKSDKELRMSFIKNEDELMPVARDVFGYDGWVVRFERNGEGQVARMLISNGRVYNVKLNRVTINKM